MALLRATGFFADVITGPGPITLYTVPAGHRIILRSINLHNEEATAQGVTIQKNTTGAITSITLTAIGTAGGNYNLQPWVVLGPGDVIRGFCGSGKHATIILSGSLLFI